MKIPTVPMLLTLALCLIQDATSEDANQETCSEFQAFMKNGKLFCSQDKTFLQTPDGVMFIKKCASCKMILEQEAKSQKKARHLARATEVTAPAQDVCSAFRAGVKDGRLECTKENDPVLGPDGKTHGNRCAMCAELFLEEAKKKEKEEEGNRIRRDAEKELCKEFENQVKNGMLFCTRERDPIRGPDGRKHNNKCSMCAKIFMKRFTEDKSKAEQNRRNAENKVKVKRETEKICREYWPHVKNGKLPCTKEDDPIQGPDGKHHGNVCYMCEAFFKQEEKAREKAKRAAAKEACSEFWDQVRDGMFICTKENDPVIGLDGKMHANKCAMCESVFKLEEEKKNNDQEEKEKAEEDKVKREAIQELCNAYRSHVRDGKLPCTRENDPIKGLDGKVHANTCSMCEAFFLQEAKEKEATSRAKVKRETVKDTCNEFRSLSQNGDLFCTRENDPVIGPDGKQHGNKCAMCKAVFEKENEDRKKKEENQRITSGHGSGSDKGKDQDSCAEFRGNMKNGELSCTRESDPVRGADGKSYSNKCSMCKELLQREAEEKNKNSGSRSHENGSAGGKDVCDQFRSKMQNGKLLCTRESDPVRDPNGKMHGNKCAMCKERLEKEAGEKKKKDDEVKRNTGEKKDEKEDECMEFRKRLRNGQLTCTRQRDPVRGADGKVYRNQCFQCRAILLQEKPSHTRRTEREGRLESSSSSLDSEMCKHYRVLPRMGYLCPKDIEPVCGDDGQTYNNPCMLCHENLIRQANTHIRSKGRCEEKSTPEAASANSLASDK